MDAPIGFIGLGNMGAPMAAHLAGAGYRLLVHDTAGTRERAPAGAGCAADNREVARGAGLVILSLPDGGAVARVVGELAGAGQRRVHTVIDTSTIGIAAARAAHASFSRAGVEYLDAPVSGGAAGARNATIALMFAGPDAAFRRHAPLLGTIAARVVHVGREAGLGQAMKLLNNFLSAVAMSATSEAIAFGEGQGLDMATMLEVLNASTGRNSATAVKFPERILTGTYDAGFTARLLEKDLRLYLEAVAEVQGVTALAPEVRALWRRLVVAEPDADLTRMYPFVKEGRFREPGRS